ncbi:M48 family metalloprotease [Pseudomonas sp. DTU_2021_1001937_2_SI_NGA_ILE_001]|uniref:M48 family metallopeptidase n=1 Tax=Pseudomonas sp. DTU_2021_1001937_2_SI_NGA_ILE_001 TaxID=3077589 RepID=UPI0028FC10F4|nr:M48 family metalloprotease [Pseudomonas sp. DTU_2021_1001937_2_SI_NGA_ILE_001]WNW12450.1 M48 family metalloprotease [Pseudomonas sp. DTU_2021_1001937_2_SI_NGA_ILE_001]
MKLLKLVALLILLPLGMALFGAWELQRSVATQQENADLQVFITEILPTLRQAEKQPGMQMVEVGEERIPVSLALQRAEKVADEMDTLHTVDRVRHGLAVTVISLSLLAMLIGLAGLLDLRQAAARAQRSRERLLESFSQVRKRLPFVLVGHVLAMGTVMAAIFAFEGLGMWHAGRMSSGESKLLFIAGLAALGCLYSLWRVARQLHLMLHLFEPVPLTVLGRSVSREQAPGLWRFVETLAERLGALPPQHIVLGIAEGFYVTSSDVQLQPEDALLSGRTLHVPVTYLGLLDSDEISAVIGHELGHFVGEDTEYSLRFLPIYDGIGRSLEVLAGHMLQGDPLQRAILRPALMLGVYFMERFDHSVHHWNRVRELAADSAGARLGGNLAAASALVRISVLEPLLVERINEHIRQAIEEPDEGGHRDPLPVCLIRELAQSPLVLPAEEMAVQLPHPSDTHPSNGERLAALQVDAAEAVNRGTRPIDAAQACEALEAFFSDPQALCMRLGQDCLGHFVEQDAEIIRQLQEDVGQVSGDVPLHEGGRVRGVATGFTFIMVAAAGMLLLVLPWMSPERTADVRGTLWAVGGILASLGLMMLPLSIRLVRRAHETALLLTPEHLVFANLEKPVPIRDIADFNLVMKPAPSLQFLIEDHAPLPQTRFRSFFRPCVRVLEKKRMLDLTLVQFCRDNKALKPQELMLLVVTYLNAANARHFLQQREAGQGEMPAEEPAPPERGQ